MSEHVNADGTAPRHTALYERHLELGAKLADFGGWEMPIEYPGGGVVKEHHAVRDRVGLFDASHLGKVDVKGPGAAAFVDSCLTNALERIGPGQAQYTLCCDESGGTVDDLLVYLRSADDVLLVPNAANTAEVARRLTEQAPAGISVVNRHTDYGVLTLLTADPVPGLQIFRDDVWHPWSIAPGTFVCNIGDMLARWTNDRWQSTLHRVVPPPADVAGPVRRRSIARFLDGDPTMTIECIASCVSDAHPARYGPVNAGEWLHTKIVGGRTLELVPQE